MTTFEETKDRHATYGRAGYDIAAAHRDNGWLIKKLEQAVAVIQSYEEAGPMLLSMTRREKARVFLEEMGK